jgi:hypothetical protein
MSTKKPSSLMPGIIAIKGSAAPSARTPVPKMTDDSADRIAVTVRLAPALYRQLKMHGLDMRKSNQDIFVEALETYLRNSV